MKHFAWAALAITQGVLLAACSKPKPQVRTATYIETSSRPAWTPDGKGLVFTVWIDENYELLVIGADGTGERRLTRDKTYDGSPSVSPDGKSVVYESMAGGDRGIYVIGMDGANPVRVGSTQSNETQERAPIWLSNSEIVFVGLGGGNPDLFRAKPNGQGLSRVSTTAGLRELPSISPDGKRIAFRSKASWPPVVVTMNADGSNEQAIASAGALDWPTWSPDASQLAYVVAEEGGSGIHAKHLTSAALTRISPKPKADDWYWCPEWSPDGAWVVFNEHVGQVWGIAIARPDGSGYVRIRTSQKWEGHPVWSPDSTRVAFHSDADRCVYVVDIGSKAIRKVR